MWADKFENVSILLPALNETFSFEETVQIILEECAKQDLRELIAIVCDRSTKECLASIEKSKKASETAGVEFQILWQTTPGAGGALRDGIDIAKGSHIISMSTDLETNPHSVQELIEQEKQAPDGIVTTSRWLKKGSFQGYNKTKYVLNFLFQKMFSLYYGVYLTDLTYSYQIAPAKLYKSIRWEQRKHPFFLELTLKPVRLKVPFREIPTDWVARQEGESQNTLLQTFKYLPIAFKVRFESREKILKQTEVDT